MKLQRVQSEIVGPTDWRSALKNAITRPEELLRALDLPMELLPAAQAAAQLFPLRVTRSYLSRIVPRDINDPLLRQILPISEELTTTPGYTMDPVGDLDSLVTPGVLHKYQGRALLISTGACAIHCRYCFRRHFPYQESHVTGQHWKQALETLGSDNSIHEVILSGGDPLMLDDAKLSHMINELEAIPHLHRLRIHTRLPITVPERINGAMLGWIRETRFPVVLVLHTNHPNELAAPVGEAMASLRHAGATLLNQAVLLRGVNDKPETLIHLSEKLFDYGVLPYYLHLFDKVQNAAHFDVSPATAIHLRQAMLEHLPGYLVPRFVQEHVGAASKSPL